jgi:hypothetical protein
MNIIILNWEGDNFVYCGSAYGFATSPTTRNACLAKYNISSRLNAFVMWSQLRKNAIEAARARHPQMGLAFGVEFNNLDLFTKDCKPDASACADYPTVLSVIPQIDPVRTANGEPMPLCSYSAYDSLADQTLGPNLAKIMNSCGRVILGEVGYHYTIGQEELIRSEYTYFEQAIQPFLSRIPSIIYWNGFDDTDEAPTAPRASYGLWLGNGTPLDIQFLPSSLGPPSR